MQIEFRPTGSWRGHKSLWFHPGAPELRSEATLEVAPTEINYTWSYEDRPQKGVMRLTVGEGVVVDWHDTFHASAGMVLTGRAEADLLAVSGTYSDGQGGPDWGWRIEVALGGVPRIQMFNITPDGQEALAVDLVTD